MRARRGLQRFVLDYHPFDVVGWDGYVYPYSFNIHDFEPKSGRLHQPPTVHQTFQGPNFVICSFCPRQLDWDPLAVPIPYHHSNLQSEEVIYYVDGQFGSRAGVGAGALTLHPSGLPHGPQPGRVEAVARRDAHRRARGHVRHVPPAAADDARARARRPELRAELARGGAGAGGLSCRARGLTRRVRISHLARHPDRGRCGDDAPSADIAPCASSRRLIPRSARNSAAVCVAALEHVAPRERKVSRPPAAGVVGLEAQRLA